MIHQNCLNQCHSNQSLDVDLIQMRIPPTVCLEIKMNNNFNIEGGHFVNDKGVVLENKNLLIIDGKVKNFCSKNNYQVTFF